MNVELSAMLWGAISGAAVFALGLYWLWDLKPSNAETGWLRSEVKDIRKDVKNLLGDVEDLSDEYNGLNKRVHALEHPPFKPEFGDWVMAENSDKSGKTSAIYLGTRKDGIHRVIAKTDGGTSEYDTELVEPLND